MRTSCEDTAEPGTPPNAALDLHERKIVKLKPDISAKFKRTHLCRAFSIDLMSCREHQERSSKPASGIGVLMVGH